MEQGELLPNDENLIDYGDSLYEKKRSVSGIILNVIIIVFCCLVLAQLLFNSIYTGIYVVNISMQPTFIGAEREDVSGGDFIYINTCATPQRGDIVVVARETVNLNGKTERSNIIKRVVAFGGDTVMIERGVLYVNGEEVKEDYLAAANNDPSLNNFGEHVVEENCMFLLGDNRNMSSDSRENGDYPIKNLLGVVPEWSQNTKGFSTAIYTFFNFTIFGK